MNYQILHDKKDIAGFCAKNPYLHIYSFGDLDDFFWKYTTWFAYADNTGISELVLLYQGVNPPTLLAFTENPGQMKNLLSEIRGFLPPLFYAHLSPGLEESLLNDFELKLHSNSLKMALVDKNPIDNGEFKHVLSLSSIDLDEIEDLYRISYPGNWFDKRMLETRQYFGMKKNNKLVAISGIHVYSEEYGVAALGNITTHPDWRGKGYGKTVTGKLCQSLSDKVEYIGLNVNAENHAAIKCYEKLGFKTIARYNEFSVKYKC